MNSTKWFPLFILLSLFLAGCTEGERDIERDDSVSAKEQLDTQNMANHPGGPTELPTPSTAAPGLLIDLPGGYAVKSSSIGNGDEIVVLEQATSQLDSAQLANATSMPGSLVVIRIGESVEGMDMPGSPIEPIHDLFGAIPTTWEGRVEQGIGSHRFFSYQTTLDDFFGPLSPDGPARSLRLVAYVGGTDSAAVQNLIHRMSTITILPD